MSEREQGIVEMAGELADLFATRAQHHDVSGEFPFDNYEEMRASGYLALTVPEELGGGGANLHEMFLAQERLAMGDGATALAVNMHVNGMGQWGSIWQITRDPGLEEVLRGAASGEVIWAGLTSERGSEKGLMDATTQARSVDGGFRFDGYKIFCTNSLIATHYALTAHYDDPVEGPQLMIARVPRDSEGFELVDNWDVMGMRSTRSIDLKIEDVFVDSSWVLHRQPAGHLNEVVARTILGWGQSSFGAVYTGIAAGAISWAKEMAVKRGRHEDPLVQALFAEMEILLETSRAVLYRHATEVAEGSIYRQLSVQEVIARAAIAKTVPVDNALAIMRKVVDAVGGPTFMRSHPFERMWRDMQAGPIMPLSNLAARELIGRTTFGIEFAPESPAPALQQAVSSASSDQPDSAP